MNGCSVDFTNPNGAMAACLAVFDATPHWPWLLALGTATAALVAFFVVVLLMALRRWL